MRYGLDILGHCILEWHFHGWTGLELVIRNISVEDSL